MWRLFTENIEAKYVWYGGKFEYIINEDEVKYEHVPIRICCPNSLLAHLL